MTCLFRASHRWQARNACKALAGAVRYELDDIEGRPVMLDFRPRVEYCDEWEPMPWCVVADKGKILAAGRAA